MDQKPIKTSPANFTSVSPASQPPALAESREAQRKLDDLLAASMTLQKMYGRAPEAMDAITDLFHSLLRPYPADKVIRAFETWISRSQEFPTPADIIGLIRRNGRSPLTEAQIVAINRKAGEDRTDADWQFLRDWEVEKSSAWSAFPDPAKDVAAAKETARLRMEVKAFREEKARLEKLLAEEQNRKKAIPTLDDKVQATVAWMRETGASEEDVQAFIASAA